MKRIYLPYVPLDIEQRKDSEPTTTTIVGSFVYVSEVFKALLRYGSYDELLVPARGAPPRGDLREHHVFSDHRGRIRFVEAHNLAELPDDDHLVFFAAGLQLGQLRTMRDAIRKWRTPIVGVTHSLNHPQQLQICRQLWCPPAEPFDAVICSSAAGQIALSTLLDQARDGAPSAGASAVHLQIPRIPLGVDTNDVAAVRRNGRTGRSRGNRAQTLLYFGRLSPASKSDLIPLIVAFAAILRDGADAALILAGDDTQHNLSGQLEQTCRELGCGDRVRIVPNPSSAAKRELFATADVFVSLADSLQETFGLTLVEAMAAGLPVVASDWDGYRDIVVPGETGFLVPTTLPCYPPALRSTLTSGVVNAPDLLAATTVVDVIALRAALATLVRNPELRAAQGRAARQRAAALFDWRVIVAQYEQLFDQLVERGCQAHAPCVVPRMSDRYDYTAVFGHYATQVDDGSTTIQQAWQPWPVTICLTSDTEGAFSAGTLDAILELLASEGPATVRRLVERCAALRGLNDATALAHVYRLWKYGFVQAVSTVVPDDSRRDRFPAELSTRAGLHPAQETV